MFRIATNEINALLRQSIRRRELLKEAARMGKINANVSTPLLARKTPVAWEELYQPLAELSGREQSIISLRFFAGLKHDQIADVLDMRSGAVRVALNRALNKLRVRLRDGDTSRDPAPGEIRGGNKVNDHLHDDWEALLFEQLPVESGARDEHRQHLKTQVLGAYEDAVAQRIQRLSPRKIGQTLMKYKVPHCTAAGILIVCAIWLAWLTQSGGTPALAANEVVDNLAKARSARYDMTVTVTGQASMKMKAYYLEPNHFRLEHASGYINIADWTAGKMVGLDPETKQATVFNLVNLPTDAKREMQTNQFDAIRESLRMAAADPNARIESLGNKQLDGRTVVGFRFKSGPIPMILWADPQTKLPVRNEAKMVGPPETRVVSINYEFIRVDLRDAGRANGYPVSDQISHAIPTTVL